MCSPNTQQVSLQYLRRLSLDLLGRAPTYEESWKVMKAGKVSPQTIDEMLKSPDFQRQIRAYHKDLLWTNISNLRAANVNYTMNGNGTTIPIAIASQGRRRNYRGANIGCLNEPAQYNSDGSIKTKCRDITTESGSVLKACQEGYVMIKPYWSPTKEVKVCAFDANPKERAYDAQRRRTYDCSSTSSSFCGCGPQLRYCQYGSTRSMIMQDMAEQMLRYMDNIVRDNRPYSDVILGRDIEVNGPVSHWLRYQTRTPGGLLYATPEQNYKVPAVAFVDRNKWVKVDRGALHSGILTMAGFLLKFQSNRGRANRFYNAFLCKHFQAPPGGLPAANSECHNEPNLMKRCGCKYCHVGVEPAAAYWGRWAEAGLSPLNAKKYPQTMEACKKDNAYSNGTCRRLYFIKPNHKDEEKYKGMLRSYVFANATMKRNIETGPRGIAQNAVSTGQFASCTTQNMWRYFVGQAPTIKQQELVSQLSAGFKKNNYKLKALIKQIVMSDEYKYGRLKSR